MEKIRITTNTVDSTIFCGEGAFDLFRETYGERTDKLFLITDSNVAALYEREIDEFFSASGRFVIPAGEESKNYKTLIRILSAMLESGATRSSVVVALGGGVVGDIAGLAASLFMRGVKLVQIPTTLLSQVDSSVGGKTAVDLNGVKNAIGTFYQPSEVYADPTFLETLPMRELRCGMGEIVKYGAICSQIYRSLILNNKRLYDVRYLQRIIPACIRYKAKVVKEDEKDLTGARRALNLGHTTGHAFELYYGRRSHGECVAIGAYYELYIARKKGICTDEGYARVLCGLLGEVITSMPHYKNIEEAARFAAYDKKNSVRNEVTIIAPKSEGEYAEIKLPLDEYVSLVRECRDDIADGNSSGRGKRKWQSLQ